MITDLFILLAGLILIVRGGDLFVSAAVRTAAFLRLPRVVIGSTLVSLTTTMPEVVVSVTAGLRGESDLALGNAVGSCICNLALILGVTALIKQVAVHPRVLRVPLTAMVIVAVVTFVMTLDLALVRWQGLVLLAGGMGYFAWDFARNWRARVPAELREAAAIQRDVVEAGAPRLPWFHTGPGTAVQFAGAAVLVIIGSRLLVDGATSVASALGIPTIVIGLTLVSVGTSLPELVTAVTSARKAVSDLAVGNLLGANIANLTLVVGVAASIHDVGMSRVTQLFNFPALLIIMGLLTWMLVKEPRLTRREGKVLLSCYGVYLLALVGLTVGVR